MFPREISSYHHHHCSNCGELGHLNRSCREPITSYGIVCIRFLNKCHRCVLETNQTNSNVCLPIENTFRNKFLSSLRSYQDKVLFLLIRRRHSLGILEFVRGRYEVEDFQGIICLFKLMTTEEIHLIHHSSDFKEIWEAVWNVGTIKPRQRSFLEDKFEGAQEKYNILKFEYAKYNILGLVYYTTQISPEWSTPEWGFPKGRMITHEGTVECAIREFEEETGYNPPDHLMLEYVKPVIEVFNGTNMVPYKHVYFLSLLTADNKDPMVMAQNSEIGDVGWFTYKEAVKLFRPYHTEKLSVLNQVFRYTVSQIETSRLSQTTSNKPEIIDVADPIQKSDMLHHHLEGTEVSH